MILRTWTWILYDKELLFVEVAVGVRVVLLGLKFKRVHVVCFLHIIKLEFIELSPLSKQSELVESRHPLALIYFHNHLMK